MAELNKTLIQLMEEYTYGQGWSWGNRDCIGLLFYIVNHCAPNKTKREDYMPQDLSYTQTIYWLLETSKFPLEPYMQMMSDSGLTPCVDGKRSDAINIIFGGEQIQSKEGEIYPVNIVPGIIFETKDKQYYALLKSGLREVTLIADKSKVCYRYPLAGLR